MQCERANSTTVLTQVVIFLFYVSMSHHDTAVCDANMQTNEVMEMVKVFDECVVECGYDDDDDDDDGAHENMLRYVQFYSKSANIAARYLSNFTTCRLNIHGDLFTSIEHFFQASKYKSLSPSSSHHNLYQMFCNDGEYAHVSAVEGMNDHIVCVCLVNMNIF